MARLRTRGLIRCICRVTKVRVIGIEEFGVKGFGVEGIGVEGIGVEGIDVDRPRSVGGVLLCCHLVKCMLQS